jgi:hypothetical protein
MLKLLLTALVLAVAPIAGASAGDLPKPTGDVVLTVKGAIDNVNSDKVAVFDLAMLEAAAGRSATMRTPWADGKTTFEGPFLRSILTMVGAHGKSLRVIALNDYASDVPIGDATNYDTILATKMNGERMSVRDKGPLFLIYPFDTNEELYNEKYFSRSVWQIKEIEVVD